MLNTVFGFGVSVSYVYRTVRNLNFSWRKLGVSPFNRNSVTNFALQSKYAQCFDDLKELSGCRFFFVDESSFTDSLRKERGYVVRGSKDGVAERRSV